MYRFLSDDARFEVLAADKQGLVYFPLVNEGGLLSAITPDLQGDIKTGQHTFLNSPVSFEDLHLSRASRNFWLTFHEGGKHLPWSVSGRSVQQRATDDEDVVLQAGLLWQEIKRTSKKRGVEATVLSFVPQAGPFEVMYVEVKNISSQPLEFTPTAAIPLYGRSADNLRDHRHVTSLLNRVFQTKHGISLRPTMSFNEHGHLINSTVFSVLGTTDKGDAPTGFFCNVESFIGPGGDLEKPQALMANEPAPKTISLEDARGKEALGGLQFAPVKLAPGEKVGFTLLLAIAGEKDSFDGKIGEFASRANIQKHLDETQKYWREKVLKIRFHTGDPEFNRWVQWVQIQPMLRKIFGCSFLPDFDYGRGGRGWRDLWQDCLALLLTSPEEVRADILGNYGGVRIDGSNATIIGRNKGADGKWTPEFIGDRNNITRVWMDHGLWPLLTTALYINQSGDMNFLLEPAPYFRDGLHARTAEFHPEWNDGATPDTKLKLTTREGKVYKGTVLEHILIETLVQFFNVGEHNIIRLEDADWNDGLDMASERGESVAFAAMYAGNLEMLAKLLEEGAQKAGWSEIRMAEEIVLLLDRVRGKINYDSIDEKKKRLDEYFKAVAGSLKGAQAAVPVANVVNDLRDKAQWLKTWIDQHEWIEVDGQGWFNGYYDNEGRRVEGKDKSGRVRMTLTGQVYPIMTGVASEDKVRRIIESVNKHLYDKELGGVRLNTDFGGLEPALGRAFGFSFGEKENGAVFSHMAVMYANALYQRGFTAEGHRILQSLFKMAKNSGRSRIYPGLPEYFNNQGRGRYAYLTGSASWFVMTLLIEVFGVRGAGGDLLLAPRLEPEQFDQNGQALVDVPFGGTKLSVTYHNAKRLPAAQCKILSVKGPHGDVPFTRRSNNEVLIQREILKQTKELSLTVELGPC